MDVIAFQFIQRGSDVLLPIPCAGSTAIYVAHARSMGRRVVIEEDSIDRLHLGYGSIGRLRFGNWTRSFPQDTHFWIVGRHPLARFKSTVKTIQFLYGGSSGHPDLVLEKAAKGETEYHICTVSNMLRRLRGIPAERIHFLRIEDCAQWQDRFNLKIPRLPHPKRAYELVLTPEQEARVKQVYADDYRLFDYEC
jgi:hypothetical protein